MKTTDAFTAFMLLMLMESMIDLEPSARAFIYILIMVFYFIDFLVNTFRQEKIVTELKDIKEKLNSYERMEP